MQEFRVAEKPENCMRCQHCLAICPEGAISILGVDPSQTIPLSGNLPDPEKLATLMKGRRSVRSYAWQNVPPETLQSVLHAAWHAPTGVNVQKVCIHLVDQCETAEMFRREAYECLASGIAEKTLPTGHEMDFLASADKLWREKQIDLIFRGAPHFLVTSVPKDAPCSLADGHIFVAYFELMAQAKGLGTVWNGMIMHCLNLFPELRARLGIPEDHNLGYAMSFGPPKVAYHRTVLREPVNIHRPTLG